MHILLTFFFLVCIHILWERCEGALGCSVRDETVAKAKVFHDQGDFPKVVDTLQGLENDLESSFTIYWIYERVDIDWYT